MADLQGYRELQARLEAIKKPPQNGYMNLVGLAVVAELKKAIPRKTSQTSRTIHVAHADADSATVEGNAVAKWLDEGTGLFGPRHQKITPRAKKALAFHVGSFGKGGSLRLTGKPRKGAAGLGATLVVVRSVRGMKPRPYVDRAIDTVKRIIGVQFAAEVVRNWNRAG